MLNNTAALLKTWKGLNTTLSNLYREAAHEAAQGFVSRKATRDAMDAAEKAEHAAWLAYRVAEDAEDAQALAEHEADMAETAGFYEDAIGIW